jgi:hypothetical protein
MSFQTLGATVAGLVVREAPRDFIIRLYANHMATHVATDGADSGRSRKRRKKCNRLTQKNQHGSPDCSGGGGNGGGAAESSSIVPEVTSINGPTEAGAREVSAPMSSPCASISHCLDLCVCIGAGGVTACSPILAL